MKKRIFSFCSLSRLSCLILLGWLLCAALPSAGAKAEKADESADQESVQINFPDIDIGTFIQYISDLTGKNFIVDPAVKGKITIISPKSISVEDAYRVFESVLEVHGFATVPSGAVTKIIPAVEARSKGIPTVVQGEAARSDDKVVTRIIPLKYTSPEEVRKIIGPLVSKTSMVIPHEQSGLLIITDVLSNLNRLLDIIKAIDVPSVDEEVEIIPLQYASVESISKSVSQLFAQSGIRSGMGMGGRRTQSNVKIIPYERNNSLIVFASKNDIKKIRELLAQLDTEVTAKGGNIHVYYLQHANAEEIVKVLTSLPTAGKQSSKDSENSKVVQQPAQSPKTAQANKTNAATAASAQLSADIKISADPETNSLIITASPEEYLTLEEVIKQLDIPRRMVYLEALIMEVSIDKQFDIGAEWGGLGSFHDETGTLGTGFSKNNFSLISGISKGTAGMTSGATLGILKKGVKIGGTYFPNIGAMVNAFQTDSDINIIATPQILTTDNKEANITVGENVPYITSKNTTSGTSQDYTNYEYKDVGTTLKITPQINQANLLRLEISVEVTRLKSEAGVATPTTYKRNAATTVVVHDQEIVVIGGMIGQDDTSSNYKVPLLGDIPILGWLFKNHESIGRKTNMFIFISPHLVESPPELADLYYKKRDVLEGVKKGAGAVPEQLLQDKESHEHALSLIDKGFAKLWGKEYQEATKYLKQALKNEPENPYALTNLAAVYAQLGKKGKAAELYQQVLDLADKKRSSDEEKEEDKDGRRETPDLALLKAVREHLGKLLQEEKDAAALEPLPQNKEEEDPPPVPEQKEKPKHKKPKRKKHG